MKGKSSAADMPRIRIVAPTAALASGLVAPMAWSGPGDLDPGFGDVGRVSDLPQLRGSAWSLDATDDEVLLGGFDDYCYYYCDYTGFMSRMGSDGGLDAAFAAARLQDTDVRDVVVQADGRPVAVGTRHSSATALVVFRLNADGSLDAGFGTGGVVEVTDPAETNLRGTSLVLGAEGRITVAGLQGDRLLVMRFLASGAADTSFGSNGSFVWDAATLADATPKIVRVGASGYRVMVNVRRDGSGYPAVSDCRVLALTASGALDAAFGTGGVSGDVVTPTANGNSCSSIGAQRDGRVVVAGSTFGDAAQGFASRLLSTGTRDSLFAAEAVPASTSQVTALAVAGNDSIALAGHDRSGLSGALVVRLQADGHLDAVFGRDGKTLFDIDSYESAWPTVYDMLVLSDGGIVMSGGVGAWWSQRPFVVRLLGDSSGGSPGVVDIEAANYEAREAEHSANVAVRRIGGRSGPINVTYRAEAATAGYVATPGSDFTAVEGQLSWADGDDSVRMITVPIASDEAPAERPEQFRVRLSAPDGGAGLATRAANVTIAGDGFPAGLLHISAIAAIYEGHVATVNVSRDDYGAGAVSVDVAIAGGSATAGQDYSLPGQTVRLSWGDGEFGVKSVGISVIEDSREEPRETITVALSGATGGAVLGSPSTATIAILDDDGDDRSGGGGGGGGGTGGLFALLSGFAGWLRSRRRTAA